MGTFLRLMQAKFKKVGIILGKILIVAGVYFALGRLGFGMAAYSGYASPIWPASGWSLLAPLLFGKMSLVGVFLGSLLYNYEIKSDLILELKTLTFVLEAFLIAAGSTFQSFVGSSLYRKFIPKLDLTKNTSFIIRFLWIETLVCTISATVANSGLLLFGILPFESIFKTWAIWWLGDTLGVFVYFPFFLAWFHPNIIKFKIHSWSESVWIVSFLTLLAGGVFYFFRINSIPAYFALSYLLIAVIVLASLRFGLRESSLVLTLVSMFAILGTIKAPSLYIYPSKEITLLLLQSFLSAMSITSLLVLAVIRQRSDAEERLVRSYEELENLVKQRTHELDRSNHSLGTTEAIYKGLFENVPIAILECDYSRVKTRLDSLPDFSKREFNLFLKKNPKFVSECYESVNIIDANRECVRLFRANSKEEVLALARDFFRMGNEDQFRKVLFSVKFGGRVLETESVLNSCDGRIFDAAIRWSLAPEFEKTFSSVIITVAEITGKKEAERQLKSSLREKEVMLKEIHHRVKNNLQVISSLFSLQSEYENDPKIHEAFAESQSRIQTMALIHDELYQSNDLGNVEFSGYTKRLAEKIRAAYKIGPEVLLEINADILLLEISLAIPLGLALNELLTNCFKYAFPKNFKPSKGIPIIRVRIQKKSDTVILEIADNGIGLPSELNPGVTRSFGLTLVQVLTKQLKGKLHFSSAKGNGTNFQISFDLPK